MNYPELRRECDRDGIGPLFWALLVEVCARVARNYPPGVFNNDEEWSEEAYRDLAQDVTLERLLGENQLEYVLSLATDEDSLARLLAFQVRRVLAHRRSITVVDRLITRTKELVRSGGYETVEVGSDIAIGGMGASPAARYLAEAELHRGAQLIHSIPRIPSSPNAERESKIYDAASLQELIQRLLTEFGRVMLQDIRRILEITLTGWLPTILRDGEENQIADSQPELEAQRTLMTELTKSLARELDPVQRIVLLGKSQGVSDGDLALQIERSRPWIADRKTEVLDAVQQRLIDELPEELHEEATRRLLDEVAVIEEDSR